jgi:hypothetical protein
LYATSLISVAHAADPYSAALHRFIANSPGQFLAQLDGQRPDPLAADLRARVVRALPKEGEVIRLTAEQQRKLESVAPVLRAYGREGVYLVKVIELPQARLALHARFVLLISTFALAALSSAQLQGAVAHEVGHEYVWEEYEAAGKRSDARRLRELELVCDGIAAVTLARIGLDPSCWSDGLRQLYISNENSGIKLNASAYPTLAERCSFVKEIRTWFRSGSATVPFMPYGTGQAVVHPR